MRTLLIVNPNATSTTPATRDLLAHALESRTQLTVAHTQHRGHAAELAQWAATQEMDLIVVHGGDGTVNETINGFLPLPQVDDGQAWLPRLGVIPGGSANVFARALGIRPDPVVATNQLIDLLSERASGGDRRIGLGIADDRWFTFSAGVGLDADVCEAIDNSRANGHAATPARYVRTTIRQFFRARRKPPSVTLRIPDHESVTEVYYAFVTNTDPWTYLDGTPVRTNPGTAFETGLGVFAMRTMRVLPTLWVTRQLLASDADPKARTLFRVDDVPSVRIEASEPIGLQIDGDFIGRRNVVDFTAVPQVLGVVAPRPESRRHNR
ncbi:diacylglycerol kinase family lipid kinase [Nocardia terpenica]|uniref:Diacylglycerol kinase n=1 Tax=Nocardia terpenica TaxID=455432 RepID=A0A164KNI7_9NOCA|nr:diacylglycerol kinase family protein [Nocardia terpenica]KZM71565.1 diacylglycerol kinase [Nocardia terpenica]MBF6063203.1 diacylglycerol kinase family lipid kinase [Nocardia terpenica]MBF6105759.1 diacylglycerol kinase family lipid kinase [Nocardia terpenica]MBF6113657.1 diacylglycerol kinase family lipid kinase [Nocardia terpenica]MBF6119500.1 diacylglycerol kinase family lipid kinase [Nocardia terpenica]